jgi:hypothetical protein
MRRYWYLPMRINSFESEITCSALLWFERRRRRRRSRRRSRRRGKGFGNDIVKVKVR